MTEQIKFMYPESRQFPFDETCELIVRNLVDTTVPGINVEVKNIGYKYVSRIAGLGFSLWFCRIQGQLSPRLNDIAAVTQISIPGRELSVYQDESGPRLYVALDPAAFLGGMLKVNSKLSKRPRIYLLYKGRASLSQDFHYARVRSPYLVHDNDLGREYEIEPDDPPHIKPYYHTHEVFAEFDQWLKDNVLAHILKHVQLVKRADFPD